MKCPMRLVGHVKRELFRDAHGQLERILDHLLLLLLTLLAELTLQIAIKLFQDVHESLDLKVRRSRARIFYDLFFGDSCLALHRLLGTTEHHPRVTTRGWSRLFRLLRLDVHLKVEHLLGVVILDGDGHCAGCHVLLGLESVANDRVDNEVESLPVADQDRRLVWFYSGTINSTGIILIKYQLALFDGP